jgi:glutamine synthetase
MHKSDEMGLSKLAYQFLGGLMHSADVFAALFIPSVNSYKRIDAENTSSGATWSPNAITYGGNNRTHMIRIPDPGRFELRLMDGAANPYLMQAGLLASGLDGVANKRDPGKRLDINMYTDSHKLKRLRKLPANMLDAVRLFDKSDVARTAFGDEFVDSYVKLKLEEWKRFCRSVTPWELENTLDC